MPKCTARFAPVLLEEAHLPSPSTSLMDSNTLHNQNSHLHLRAHYSALRHKPTKSLHQAQQASPPPRQPPSQSAQIAKIHSLELAATVYSDFVSKLTDSALVF